MKSWDLQPSLSDTILQAHTNTHDEMETFFLMQNKPTVDSPDRYGGSMIFNGLASFHFSPLPPWRHLQVSSGSRNGHCTITMFKKTERGRSQREE